MPANEIANRLAAAAWIKCEPDSAAAPNTAYTLGLRSQVSCQNRLIVCGGDGISTANFKDCPVILLPFDRTFSRRETTIQVTPIATFRGSNRVAYPASWRIGVSGGTNYDQNLPAVGEPDVRVLCEPFHMDWLGNPAAPSFMPFGLGTGPSDTVPAGFDLDLYNALALLMPNYDDGVNPSFPLPVDIQIAVWQHPVLPLGDVGTIETTLRVTLPG